MVNVLHTHLDLLLSELEMNEIQRICFSKKGPSILNTRIYDLTVQNLHDISFVLLRSEYGEQVPGCILPVKCLEILHNRAMKYMNAPKTYTP